MHYVMKDSVLKQIIENFDELRKKDVSSKSEAYFLTGKIEAYKKIVNYKDSYGPSKGAGWSWIDCDFLDDIVTEISIDEEGIKTLPESFDKELIKGRLEGFKEIISILNYHNAIN